MNILFTSYFGENKGGAELSMKTLANGLKAKGHNVTIASSGSYSNLNCIRFRKCKNIPSFGIQNSYLSKFLEKAILKNKVGIIHANDRLTSVPAILAARKCKIKVVVHFRDYWFACPISVCLTPKLENHDVCSFNQLIHCSSVKNLPWNLYKLNTIKNYWKILDSADAKIAISNFAKEKLSHCSINNVNVIPNSVDLDLFKGAMPHKLRNQIPKDSKVISFVGHLTYIKGIKNILQIIIPILKNNPKIYFWIIGEGEQKKELENIIKIEKMENQIRLFGKIAYNEIPSLYSASDLVLVPSLMQETFGRSVIEAMAAGKPVIASAMGGLKDVVINGKTGLLVNAFNKTEWENNIIMLINSQKQLEQMGNNARAESLRYSINSVTDSVEKIYREAENASS